MNLNDITAQDQKYFAAAASIATDWYDRSLAPRYQREEMKSSLRDAAVSYADFDRSYRSWVGAGYDRAAFERAYERAVRPQRLYSARISNSQGEYTITHDYNCTPTNSPIYYVEQETTYNGLLPSGLIRFIDGFILGYAGCVPSGFRFLTASTVEVMTHDMVRELWGCSQLDPSGSRVARLSTLRREPGTWEFDDRHFPYVETRDRIVIERWLLREYVLPTNARTPNNSFTVAHYLGEE